MITPLGPDLETTWQRVCQGRAGFHRITRCTIKEPHLQVVGEISD